MSRYDSDPRVRVNGDGTVTVGPEVLRDVPGDGWCLYRGATRVGAGFRSRDALLGELLGPAWVPL